MAGIDMSGLIVAVIAAVVTFFLARNLKNRNSQRQEKIKELAEEDYHQQVGP
jgi:preprotein translocase subunit YajC